MRKMTFAISIVFALFLLTWGLLIIKNYDNKYLTAYVCKKCFTVDPATVRKVYDNPEKHAAFPDLARYGSNYYLSFREGTSHIMGVADIKILRSPDATNWYFVDNLHTNGEDLRGAYFIPSKENGVIRALVHSRYDIEKNLNGTRIARIFPDGGKSTLLPVDFGYSYKPDIDIPFTCKWAEGRYYALTYGSGKDVVMRVALVVSEDGNKWKVHTDPVIVDANEADLTIRNGKAYIIARAQTAPWNAHGAIVDLRSGTVVDTFRFDKAIHAPRLFSHAGKDYVLGRIAMRADPKVGWTGGAFVTPEGLPNPQTGLLEVDWENKKLRWILNFPHGDGPDNAYPSITQMDKNRYLVAYYSRNGKPIPKGFNCWNVPGPCIWTAELVYKK